MFKLFFKLNYLLVVLMFFHRLIFLLIFSSYLPKQVTSNDFFEVIFSGLRFDMMVLGYLNLLVITVSILLFFQNRAARERNFLFISGLFFGFIIVNSIINLIDISYFHQYSDRFTSMHGASEYLSGLNINSHTFFGFFLILFLGKLVMSRTKFSLENEEYEFNFAHSIVLFLFFALCARGSIDQHHLDLRHAEVTNNKFMNLSIVPSAYALDQAIRNRR